MMKKPLALLAALLLAAALLCTAAAEEAALPERGYSNADDFNYEAGNFEAVTFDGSVRAKIYVTAYWTADETAPAGYGIWIRENPEIAIPEEEGAAAMNLVCRLMDPAELNGEATAEGAAKLLDALNSEAGLEYGYDLCTVNGIKTLMYWSGDKYTVGAYCELPEGLLNISIDGITNEDLENEAVITLCSLIAEE